MREGIEGYLIMLNMIFCSDDTLAIFNSLIQYTNLIKHSLYNEEKDINDPNLQSFFIFSQH